MFKRKWTGVPAYIDYTAQLLLWFGYGHGLLYRLKEAATNLSYRLIDNHCKCQRCLDRLKEGVR